MSTKVQTPTTKTAARPANEQNNMSTTTKKFIGAVEDEWQLYSDCASDYVIGAPIGFGASSIVYAATYYPSSSNKPSGERNESAGIPCALKVLDLDSLPQKSLRLLQRETTLMSLSKHPNVLRVRGSWMDGHKLYIALRLMNKGSAADIMRYGWPGGMEEDVVRCILKQALKGLNYLHINGFIHRDVKAANLLIDDDGTVLLGDLGVAADLSEDISQVASTTKPYFVTATAALPQPQARPQAPGAGKRTVSFDGTSPGTHKPQIGKRKSFVGTPCWMSPELIEGKQYDSSSDIWSFGITAIELSQGRPPRSRESPQRVLLRTIQEEPPTLDREGGAFKYSRAFKDMVDCCLAKDPSKRPTAEELLQTPFFKGAKNKSYLINTILKDLPPLTQRQERRVLPAVLSANSIDSWDFGSTINSPTTSVYRRHALEGFVAAEDEERIANGIFHLGDVSPAHSRSRVVSWVGDPELDVVAEVEGKAEGETNSTPSSPGSSSHFSSENSDAATAPSPPDTSAPSSYIASSDMDHKMQATQAAHEALPKEGNLSPIAENGSRFASDTADSHRERLPEPPSASKTPKKLPTSDSQTPTLWRKFKSNVRRPSSSSGLGTDGSPRKDKEKSRINALFSSSSSKGLLSRASNLNLSDEK